MTYTDPDCVQFVADMSQAGLEVWHYHGRWFWEGPAVSVPYLQDALSETRVRCQHDSLGLGFVVYPVSSDSGTPKKKY